MSDNIKVAIRMRNLITRELESKATTYWAAKDTTSIHQIDSSTPPFSFDRIFTGLENNEMVYSEFCAPIVKSVIDGFNGTIFAYGQTSSGKTFTIMGDGISPGIAHYTVSELFEHIQIIEPHTFNYFSEFLEDLIYCLKKLAEIDLLDSKKLEMPDREFLLRVSFMEIYNEMVIDLLSNSNENLKLQEDLYGNIKVNKLTETIVQEPKQVLELMKKGQRQRRTGETVMNNKSSRSHSIFRMIVESRLRGEENAAVNVSQFNMVDLAGSEKASLNAPKGARFKEGVNINKSLFMLSQVISQLSAEKESQFINYRDSKLTRILQNSLGGNALTAIICTVTPASLDETLSTLKFALRAKKIMNKPQVNEIQTEQALLKKYANKIKKLCEELEATKEEKDQEKKIRRDMQQQIENLKKKFVSHIAPEKSRAARRETWGGCLDAARLKLFTPNLPHKSSSEEDNGNSIIPFSKEKKIKSSKFNSDTYLPILEEECEDLNCLEPDLVDDEVFSNRISIVSSKYSLELNPLECVKTENIAVQTDNVPPPVVSDDAEKLKLALIQIADLKNQFLNLKNFTTIEKQIFSEQQAEEKASQLNQTAKCPCSSNFIQSEEFEKADVSSQDMADESFSVLNHLKNMDKETVRNMLDLDQEIFFQHLSDIIWKLNQILGIETKSPNISNPYLSVIFQLFNSTFKNQCIASGSAMDDLSESNQEMLSILEKIFTGFSTQLNDNEEYSELVSKFVELKDVILREIEISYTNKKENINEKDTLPCSPREGSEGTICSNIPDVVNASFSKLPQLSLNQSVINNFQTKESQTSIHEDMLNLESVMQYQKQIILLEENLAKHIKEISKLQDNCDLREKQISIITDKVNIQEQIITGLKDELSLKNKIENNVQEAVLQKCQHLIDNYTQTYYLQSDSLDSSFHSLDMKELNKSMVDEEERNELEQGTDIFSGLMQHTNICEDSDVTECDQEDNMLKCKSNDVKDIKSCFEECKLSGNCSVTDSMLDSILKELLELKKFTLNCMECNMQKAYHGDTVEMSSSQNNISLKSVECEIKDLRYLLERIDFYLRDKSDSCDYLNDILLTRMGEISALQDRCSTTEKALDVKEKELEYLCQVLSNTKKEIETRMASHTSSACLELCQLDFEDVSTGYIKYIIYFQKAIEILEKSVQDKEAVIASFADIQRKSTSDQSSQTTENYPDLDEIERMKVCQIKEKEDLCLNIDSLKLTIKELNKTIEDAKLKEKESVKIEEIYENKLKDALLLSEEKWKVKMTEYVKSITEEYEQELDNKEKEFHSMIDDNINRFKEHQKAQSNHKEELDKLNTQYLERISHLEEECETIKSDFENKLSEEINNHHEILLKLKEEIKGYKIREAEVKQSYYKLKAKFKEYALEFKKRMQNETTFSNKECQTQSEKFADIIGKQASICKQCVSLQQEIENLRNQAKIEKAIKQLDDPIADPSKQLINDLESGKARIFSLESNNENMAREIRALKNDLASKYTLLRSCNCRLFAKPQEIIKKDEKSSTETQIPDVCKVEKAEFGNAAFRSPNDVLQIDIVQKAIQEAREEERQAFYRAEGPASDMMCLFLKRNINKKDKEIHELKELLNKKSHIHGSENNPPSAGKVLFEKNQFKENKPPSERKVIEKNPIDRQPILKKHSEKLRTDELNTPDVKPSHGAIPKLSPKRVLLKENKPIPAPQNVERNQISDIEKDKEKELQRQIRMFSGEPDINECRQQ